MKRGFIEALFILVSILLAFWIDAWWDDRQVAQLESETLLAVKAEAEENLRQLESTRDLLDFYIEGADRFLRSTPAELGPLGEGLIRRWVIRLTVPATFFPDRDASSVLATIPRSRSTESGEARRLVSRWLSRLDNTEVRRARASDISFRIMEDLSRYAAASAHEGYEGIPNMLARVSPSVLAELRRDEQFVASVIQMADARRVYVNGLDRLEQTLDSLAVVLGARQVAAP